MSSTSILSFIESQIKSRDLVSFTYTTNGDGLVISLNLGEEKQQVGQKRKRSNDDDQETSVHKKQKRNEPRHSKPGTLKRQNAFIGLPPDFSFINGQNMNRLPPLIGKVTKTSMNQEREVAQEAVTTTTTSNTETLNKNEIEFRTKKSVDSTNTETPIADKFERSFIKQEENSEQNQVFDARAFTPKNTNTCDRCFRPGHATKYCRKRCAKCDNRVTHFDDECALHQCRTCGYGGHSERICRALKCQICKLDSHYTQKCNSACKNCVYWRNIYHHRSLPCE